ncbi:hypothetical protein LB559_09165 [Mesorhizobium sp. BR1-1-3]|uniref:hypothetical protein n=1 Tax=Mesorhizobium sp. BR1-1-3 TaxID=2876651 RepID=UPI001CD17F63|nr:hypothetical protein [Mesorhizobium sp. BR1-1-3]MBZ9888108.1 hypothetical protein [Mesorhizobium sp. BR1-1-3]
MANRCNKCGGAGYIQKFSGVENGTCFKCEGTGFTLTAAERAEIHRQRTLKHDARMARQQGVSVETFRAYVGAGPVPKHPNGCSYSIQEFEAWLSETKEAA